jgi:RimJ/RimL family protein N-acetyltransferase
MEWTLHTPRLRIVAATAKLARAELAGTLSAELGVRVPPEWPPVLFADDRARFAEELEKNRWLEGWLHWYWIFEETLVGCGGFGGLPREGDVILGFAVLDGFQRRGIATEAVRAMTLWAFRPDGVRRVIADTLPHLTASIRVLEKAGFRRAGEGGEPGSIRFERLR